MSSMGNFFHIGGPLLSLVMSYSGATCVISAPLLSCHWWIRYVICCPLLSLVDHTCHCLATFVPWWITSVIDRLLYLMSMVASWVINGQVI